MIGRSDGVWDTFWRATSFDPFHRKETSMQYQIAVVVGSLRRDSYNRQLADALVKLAPTDFTFESLRIDDLPLYNQDDDSHPAEVVTRLKGKITAAHGVIFVTPEYNRSIPGVLKNAIDHASRPYGQSAWKGKPAGVLGASVGPSGTAMAQQHLRNVLAYLDMPTLAQPEAFIQASDSYFAGGEVADPANREFLQRWVDRYADWVRKLAEPGQKS
jgi:chromate reductase